MKKISNFFSRIPRIYKDTTGVFAGNILTSVLAFTFIVLVSRFLGPADFGIFSLALALLTMVSDISDFGANTGMIKFTSIALRDNKPEKAHQLIKLNFRFKLFWGAAVAFFGYLLASKIALLIFKNEALTTPLKISFLGIFGVIIFSFFLAVFQAYQQFNRRIFMGFILGLSRVLFFLVLIIFGKISIFSCLVGYITMPLICLFLFYPWLPLSFIKENIREKKLGSELFHFSKWLTISTFCVLILSRLDIFFLTRLAGPESTGIYNAAFRLGSFILLINSSFTVTLMPALFGMSETKQLWGYFKKLILGIVIISLFLLSLIFWAPAIIKIIYGSAYLAAIPVFQILILGFIAMVAISALEMILYALNRPDLFAILMMISLILSGAANYFLIPLYGAPGAAGAFLSVKIFGIIYLLLAVLIIFAFKKSEKTFGPVKEPAIPIITEEKTALEF